MSLQALNTKVCIIGAGFAGLIIANILSKYGIPCMIIEQRSQKQIYASANSALVDSKTIAILQKFGLSDRLLQVGQPQRQCEFRTPHTSFILNYAQMAGEQTHYSYPQRQLIADLIAKFQESGGEILFETQAVTIENERYGAKVFSQQENRDLIINSDFIAGCDGFDSMARAFIPEFVTQPQIIAYEYAWLEIAAQGTLKSDRIIYGIHPRGFAGQMLNTANIAHYYLQIPLEDSTADWSSDRIWAELQLRLTTKLARNNWKLKPGKIIQKQVLKMCGFATQTMQYKSIFLAGDAAHIMTPAGDKGLNLAIQDAEVLGNSFARFYRYHDNFPLINYSATRLPEIRQTQEFSESLLHMVNAQAADPTKGNNLLELLQRFKLSQLMNSDSYATEFAKKYVGYLPRTQIVREYQRNRAA